VKPKGGDERNGLAHIIKKISAKEKRQWEWMFTERIRQAKKANTSATMFGGGDHCGITAQR
jgi:hypothetical protein